MTPEDDKRISAALGVTPGEWAAFEGVVAAWIRSSHPEEHGSVFGHCEECYCDEYRHNARLMAASKEMVALLERAVKLAFGCFPLLSEALPSRHRDEIMELAKSLGLESSALLSRLKGGNNAE